MTQPTTTECIDWLLKQARRHCVYDEPMLAASAAQLLAVQEMAKALAAIKILVNPIIADRNEFSLEQQILTEVKRGETAFHEAGGQ